MNDRRVLWDGLRMLWDGLPTVPPLRPQVSSNTAVVMTFERYRIADDAHGYFVTYSIMDWLQVFVSEKTCPIVTDSLNFCHDKKGLTHAAKGLLPGRQVDGFRWRLITFRTAGNRVM